MNIRYDVHYALRQFVKTKPIKFKYNPWILYGKHVYCDNFTLYFGKESNTSEFHKLHLGTKVILNSLSTVENPKSHCIYFNNSFSSHMLIKIMKNNENQS